MFKIPLKASASSGICTVRAAALPEAGTLIIPEARRVRRSEPSLLHNEGRAGGQRGLQTGGGEAASGSVPGGLQAASSRAESEVRRAEKR